MTQNESWGNASQTWKESARASASVALVPPSAAAVMRRRVERAQLDGHEGLHDLASGDARVAPRAHLNLQLAHVDAAQRRRHRVIANRPPEVEKEEEHERKERSRTHVRRRLSGAARCRGGRRYERSRRARVAVAPLCELRAPGYTKVIFRTALPAC